MLNTDYLIQTTRYIIFFLFVSGFNKNVVFSLYYVVLFYASNFTTFKRNWNYFFSKMFYRYIWPTGLPDRY